MHRPVERFQICTPPMLLDKGPGGRCRRLRPAATEPEAVGLAGIACFAGSLGLVAYAAWLLAGLWLAP
jgi:hypothetical protein